MHGAEYPDYLSLTDNLAVSVVPESQTLTKHFYTDFYVKSSLKRTDIGSALLGTAEQWMRNNEITVSKVHLGEPKEQWFESYAFYLKHGYEEYKPRYMKRYYRFR